MTDSGRCILWMGVICVLLWPQITVSLWLELLLVGYLRSLQKYRLEQKFLEEGTKVEAKVVDRFHCTVETPTDELQPSSLREKYYVVVEFRNAGGSRVRREYIDIRNASKKNNHGDGDNTTATTNTTIDLYHLPEHPQSAYYDYGLPPRGPPSVICYGVFGGTLLAAMFLTSVYVGYAQIWMGVVWQGAMLVILSPLLVWLARSEAARLEKPYADNLLRNIPEYERVPGTHRDTRRDIGMGEAYPGRGGNATRAGDN